MGTAVATYLPFATGPGANVTEEQWRDLAEQWFPTGIVSGYLNGLAVSEHAGTPNLSVDVASGQARIRGHEGISTGVITVAIGPNGTANPRIDTVVIRGNFVTDVIEVDVVAGTAAAVAAPPALTTSSTVWELALADVYVAAGATSILNAVIRDRRATVLQVAQSATKEPARVALDVALGASTVTGLVRVANANGALGALDGVTVAPGDRILDQIGGTASKRGLWQVTDVGSASQPWRMTRPLDFDSDADVRSGCRIPVSEGTRYAGTAWILTTANPIILGTTGLTFGTAVIPSGANTITANVSLGAAQTIVVTTPSLDIGTWLVTAIVKFTTTLASDVQLDFSNFGTGLFSTAVGPRSGATSIPAGKWGQVTVQVLLTVTTAGTFTFTAYATAGATTVAEKNGVGVNTATGCTCIRVA